MTTVQQVLMLKGHHVHRIRPQAVVYDAVALMAIGTWQFRRILTR